MSSQSNYELSLANSARLSVEATNRSPFKIIEIVVNICKKHEELLNALARSLVVQRTCIALCVSRRRNSPQLLIAGNDDNSASSLAIMHNLRQLANKDSAPSVRSEALSFLFKSALQSSKATRGYSTTLITIQARSATIHPSAARHIPDRTSIQQKIAAFVTHLEGLTNPTIAEIFQTFRLKTEFFIASNVETTHLISKQLEIFEPFDDLEQIIACIFRHYDSLSNQWAADEKGFVKLLLTEPRSISGSDFGEHAELKILAHLTKENYSKDEVLPFLAISKLCCAPCQILLESFNKASLKFSITHAGTHGKVYPKWKLVRLNNQETELIDSAYLFFAEKTTEILAAIRNLGVTDQQRRESSANPLVTKVFNSDAKLKDRKQLYQNQISNFTTEENEHSILLTELLQFSI